MTDSLLIAMEEPWGARGDGRQKRDRLAKNRSRVFCDHGSGGSVPTCFYQRYAMPMLALQNVRPDTSACVKSSANVGPFCSFSWSYVDAR